ncbi:MAG: ABC transporter permease [Microthrixaceae bacterium]
MFLFAPVAVVVPLTISTAVGAATIVGERERGTGEFLAHSPASAREIYLGKLIASLVPGYLTTVVGFGLYSLLVNVIVGPEVGGWFFPTAQWWVLMFWVLPPFLAITLSLVLRLSARVKSTAAAQQASGLVTLPLIMIAYGQTTGALFGAQVWASTWASSPGSSPSSASVTACARSPGPASSASPTRCSAAPTALRRRCVLTLRRRARRADGGRCPARSSGAPRPRRRRRR